MTLLALSLYPLALRRHCTVEQPVRRGERGIGRHQHRNAVGAVKDHHTFDSLDLGWLVVDFRRHGVRVSDCVGCSGGIFPERTLLSAQRTESVTIVESNARQ